MTKAPTESTSDQSSTQSSSGWLGGVLVLVFRLLLLGVGSVVAVLIGVAIATVFPGKADKAPLLETVFTRGSLLRQALQQSPGTALDELLGQGNSEAPAAPAPSDLASGTDFEATPDIAQTDDALRITLPSDVLFESGSSELLSDSQPIFDTVVQEIQRYPGATVQIAAYGDRAATVARNRQTAFEQAQVVQRYLTRDLDEDLYHWVTIGYGKATQRSESSESPEASMDDEPPYRRVEISIVLE